MKKMIIFLLIGVLFLSFVVVGLEGAWIYYAKNRVAGRNMEVIEFQDDLGIIGLLIEEDSVKRNINKFKSDVTFAIGEEDLFEVDNFRFEGNVRFDDKTKLKYSLEDFEVEWTEVAYEGDYVEVGGNAILKYEAVIVITKEIPVEVMADFYRDLEDKSYQENNIEIVGEDLLFVLENGNFKQRYKCSFGCD